MLCQDIIPKKETSLLSLSVFVNCSLCIRFPFFVCVCPVQGWLTYVN